MRKVPAALRNHLANDATTTCHCWRVTRRDGAVFGFTEHDRDLTFDGTTYLAASGFAASDTEAATGLSANAGEVAGGFSSVAISEDDLAAGRYDGARVELFLVNWAVPEQNLLLNMREIGEVSRAGGEFRAELRSLTHRLDQPQGRLYGRRCDARLGDERCRVDLSAWCSNGQVSDIVDESRVVVSGLSDFAAGFFDRGTMTFSGGPTVDVETHVKKAGGLAVIGFWLPLDVPIAVGRGFSITAGCDKSFATCQSRFSNQLNFRGFPHVPGTDFAYSYVDGERVHDGGALFE